jgi:hypothetical protein
MRDEPLFKEVRAMGAMDRLKRDLKKHRGKAAVLGMLFVVMVAMSVRAVMELRPQAAGAAVVPAVAPEQFSKNGNKEIATGADAEARIQESKDLWRRLREVKATATEAKVAFTFDASYYPPPAVSLEARPMALMPEATAPAPTPMVDEAAVRSNRIREQARALIVKSTAVGHEMTEPMAIVNQQLLTVGQKILGFEITAIRAREVEFVKEGVTTVVKMPDGQ